MTTLLTVDVWDTVLRRRCHPEAIKLRTARRAVSALARFPGATPSAVVAHRLRVEAESQLALDSAADGGDEEYSILDVIPAWLILMNPALDAADRNALAAALIDREIADEISSTYVDPGIVSFLARFEADRTILLSDFYVPESLLSMVLRAKVTSFYERIVVSCDVGLNKRSGRLFDWLSRELGATYDVHIHVGDNAHSDVAVPNSKGITGVLYQPRLQHLMRGMRSRLYQVTYPRR